MYRIVHKEQLSPVVHLMVIEAPDVAAKAQPANLLFFEPMNKERVRLQLPISTAPPERSPVFFGSRIYHQATGFIFYR